MYLPIQQFEAKQLCSGDSLMGPGEADQVKNMRSIIS